MLTISISVNRLKQFMAISTPRKVSLVVKLSSHLTSLLTLFSVNYAISLLQTWRDEVYTLSEDDYDRAAIAHVGLIAFCFDRDIRVPLEGMIEAASSLPGLAEDSRKGRQQRWWKPVALWRKQEPQRGGGSSTSTE